MGHCDKPSSQVHSRWINTGIVWKLPKHSAHTSYCYLHARAHVCTLPARPCTRVYTHTCAGSDAVDDWPRWRIPVRPHVTNLSWGNPLYCVPIICDVCSCTHVSVPFGSSMCSYAPHLVERCKMPSDILLNDPLNMQASVTAMSDIVQWDINSGQVVKAIPTGVHFADHEPVHGHMSTCIDIPSVPVVRFMCGCTHKNEFRKCACVRRFWAFYCPVHRHVHGHMQMRKCVRHVHGQV